MAEASNYTAIVAAILAHLDAAGCLNTYDYEPLAHDPATFIGQFKTTGNKIEGWTISRGGFTERRETTGQAVRRHRFVIRGYAGVEEATASGKAFQARIEAISDRLRGDYDMSGTAELHDGPQGDTIDNRMFGPVLAHYCEVSIWIQELLLHR